jgi:putative ABC transport system substrate-binding protein
VNRREFITILACVMTRPPAGHAQSPAKARRIGVLRLGEPPPSYILPFRQALSRLGYVEGQNLVIEYGLAQDVDGLPEMARDLVRRKVDVILASGVPSIVPAQTASSTTPVVFVAAVDPKAAHLVTSLAEGSRHD